MCFGNNPSCKCCSFLPVWSRPSVTTAPLRRTNGAGHPDNEVFSSQVWGDESRYLEHSVANSQHKFSATYEYYYTLEYNAPGGQSLLTQQRASSPGVLWQHDIRQGASPISSVQDFCVGPHGIYIITNHGGSLRWTHVEKDGTVAHACKLISDFTATGHIGLNGFNFKLSPNSSHAIAEAPSSRQIIGDLVVNSQGANVVLHCNGIKTINNSTLLTKIAVAGGELYWIATYYRIPGNVGTLKYNAHLPGFDKVGGPDLPATNVNYDLIGWDSRNGGDISFSISGQIAGLEDKELYWGHILHGTEYTINSGVLPAQSPQIPQIHAAPVGGNVIMDGAFYGLTPETHLALMPDIDISGMPTYEYIGDTYLETFRYYYTPDLKKCFLRPSHLQNRIAADQAVVPEFDGVTHNITFTCDIVRRDAGEVLPGTVARFRCTFNRDLQADAQASDFAVVPTGDVSAGLYAVAKIADKIYDIDVYTVTPGESGGTIVVTLSSDNEITTTGGVAIKIPPTTLERYTVPAA